MTYRWRQVLWSGVLAALAVGASTVGGPESGLIWRRGAPISPESVVGCGLRIGVAACAVRLLVELWRFRLGTRDQARYRTLGRWSAIAALMIGPLATASAGAQDGTASLTPVTTVPATSTTVPVPTATIPPTIRPAATPVGATPAPTPTTTATPPPPTTAAVCERSEWIATPTEQLLDVLTTHLRSVLEREPSAREVSAFFRQCVAANAASLVGDDGAAPPGTAITIPRPAMPRTL